MVKCIRQIVVLDVTVKTEDLWTGDPTEWDWASLADESADAVKVVITDAPAERWYEDANGNVVT